VIVATLRKQKEKGGSTTRKLIGHSGPVYSVDFDPVSGSAAPPRYLISASADATARLWSLDTMTGVVAYRGHQNPVWDVRWSPMGIYFATGSRDKTARLWSTDRTSALRIYAGHLSDVDVCFVCFIHWTIHKTTSCPFSVSDFIRTHCT
jgi:transcription initiation factor TFIID subunit 5